VAGDDDFYPQDVGADGVRTPDPTLGMNLGRPVVEEPDAAAEALAELLSRSQPENPAKIRRRRVVLSDPRQSATTLRARVELEEQTSWGELLITGLVKAQLKTSLLLGGLVVLVLLPLPVLFYLVPSFSSLKVIGVPLPWLILGVVPFPLLFAVGLWYNRLAERHERAFVDMIEN
jgi:hypothetical protein